MISTVSGRKKYGKMICHMTWLHPKLSNLHSLSESGSTQAHLTYFRPKLEIFNTSFYQYRPYIFLNFSYHSASNEIQQVYAVINSLGNSIQLWFDDVIITYTSFFHKLPPIISRDMGSKFLSYGHKNF